MNGKNVKFFWLILILSTLLLSTGCKKSKIDNDITNDKPIVNNQYTINTTIAYSAGDDSNWSYVNQRKEFPNSEACYVRVSSVPVAEKSKFAGDTISITYRFIGYENCNIEVSDGFMEKIENDDPNIIEFKKTLTMQKKKEAKDNLSIFRYIPSLNAENVVLEVIYDDTVDPKYNMRSTIYFY